MYNYCVIFKYIFTTFIHSGVLTYVQHKILLFTVRKFCKNKHIRSYI